MASKINADEFVDREGEGKPTLPKGVVLSGVTTITTAVVAENEVANTGGINVGIITSTHFAGNLTGDVNAGIVTVTSQSVIGSAVTISASGIDIGAGVITATSYAGSGANLTGIGATIMIWEYNPDPYDTAVTFDTGIGITFNQKIKAGSGNITLREDNASGTVVENFGIGSSVTIADNSLSLTPASDLSEGQVYYLELPSGVITNMAGDNYVGTAYTFQARAYDYQLWAWGYNAGGIGNLGLNNHTEYSSPVQIPGTTWRHAGNTYGQGYTTWATKTDGTLWMWGSNGQGELGQNDIASRSSPIQIPGTNWSDMVHGGNTTNNASAAVKTDGTLWVWGTNFRGNLGQNQSPGTLGGVSSPVQIPGTTWNTARGTMGGGVINLKAIKTDGTLWEWGYGGYGSMGLNLPDATYYSSPVQLPGTTWSNIAVSKYYTLATKTDGTLWSWGYGGYGSLGVNNRTTYSSPIQIPGTTWATGEGKIADGLSSVLAIKTDGTLWSWGRNDQGMLGHNQPDNSARSSPVQIPGTTWDQVSMQNLTSMATKTDGTLWVWGYNAVGQLAQNDIAQYSSPTQIPGTDWTKVGSSVYSSFAIKRI